MTQQAFHVMAKLPRRARPHWTASPRSAGWSLSWTRSGRQPTRARCIDRHPRTCTNADLSGEAGQQPLADAGPTIECDACTGIRGRHDEGRIPYLVDVRDLPVRIDAHAEARHGMRCRGRLTGWSW